HALLHAGVGLVASGDQFFREVYDQRDAAPFLLFVGDAQEKAAQQGSEVNKITRWARGMEVGVLDVVIDLQPLEKSFLHISGAEGQTVADVVKEQAGAFGEQPADEERFEGHIIDGGAVLHGEQVENIPAKDEQGVSAAVPAAR